MGKASFSKVFVVGKKRMNKVVRKIISEPLEAQVKPVEPTQPARGKKREARFQASLIKGDILASDLSTEQLEDKKLFPSLVASFRDCLNEGELRSRFPKNGIGHNFFMGHHKLRFYVANDKTTVVAQVLKDNSPL
jgi:hypothetical protein